MKSYFLSIIFPMLYVVICNFECLACDISDHKADAKLVEYYLDLMGENEYLCLARKKLSPEELKALAEALAVNTALIKLDFSMANLGPEGAKVLAPALIKNKTLRELDVSDNGIGPAGKKAFAEALRHNFSLIKLKHVNGTIGRDLPDKEIIMLLERNKGVNRKLAMSSKAVLIILACSDRDIAISMLSQEQNIIKHVLTASLESIEHRFAQQSFTRFYAG